MNIHSRTPNFGDIDSIVKILSVTSNNGESFDKDLHLYSLIEKPWGFEYRVYCDSVFDVWKLHIYPREKTSMHCHIQKDTVLICLSGRGVTKFIDGDELQISTGQVIYIERGVFHQTISTGSGELELIEVENPRNKFDLLRLSDDYGRAIQSYEKNSLSHDLLSPLTLILPGTYIRYFDMKSKFSFSFEKLDLDILNSENVLFIVSLSIDSHLLGKINIFLKKDVKILNHIGQKVLVISEINK
ncbi:cupin domain-containing protein [Xenorhabdus sp. SGI240]|uniref:cupin domain-containing protein n=1 Tax=Xenorhabdus sp. SGI240 TaxID=3158262 RepID=UPI0032B7A66C